MRQVRSPSVGVGSPTLLRGGDPPLVDLSVAADGSMWAVDGSETVHVLMTGTAPWTSLAGAPMASLSVPADGSVWGLNGLGQFFQYTDGGWQARAGLPAGRLAQITASSSATIWGLDSGGNVASFSAAASQWSSLAAQVAGGLAMISATADGTVWGCSGTGEIYHYISQTPAWQQITAPETMKTVAAGTDGWVFTIGRSGQIYHYAGGAAPWTTYANPQGLVVLCAGDDTTLWGLDAAGKVYQWTMAAAPAWIPVDTTTSTGDVTLAALSVGARSTIAGLDRSGALYAYTADRPTVQALPMTGDKVALDAVSVVDATRGWGLSDGSVYRLALEGNAVRLTGLAGQLTAISAASDGTVWGVDQDASAVYAYNADEGTWTPQPQPDNGGNPLHQLSVGGATNIWGLDDTGAIYQYNAQTSAWTSIPAPTGRDGLLDISASSDGQVWGIAGDGVNSQLYQYVGSPDGWLSVAGRLQKISVGSATSAWGIDLSGQAVPLLYGGEVTGEGVPTANPEHASIVAWETADPFDVTRSTHLFIVTNAAQVAQDDPNVGTRLYNLVKPGQGRLGDPFHDNLCQGLYDADFKSPYINRTAWYGGAASYLSHFYDPDTGKNYWGDTSPTALTQGVLYFQQSVQAYKQYRQSSSTQDLAQAGYNLGLSLHYLTDCSQPMHAGNYTYKSSFLWGYHSDFEAYVMEVQYLYVNWQPRYVASTLGTDPAAYITAAAANAKHRYYDVICSSDLPLQTYAGLFDELRELIRTWTGQMLGDAVKYTAWYLVAWMTAALA